MFRIVVVTDGVGLRVMVGAPILKGGGASPSGGGFLTAPPATGSGMNSGKPPSKPLSMPYFKGFEGRKAASCGKGVVKSGIGSRGMWLGIGQWKDSSLFEKLLFP